jgi:hypothetical protein
VTGSAEPSAAARTPVERRRRRFLRGSFPSRVETRAGFDAFISYSRASDAGTAAALQRGLQTFAKPWYRLRILRVFRDDASLSANPGLWSSIAQALSVSRYFILLASPAAAESPWVAREVDEWLRDADPRRLLLVLTEGDLRWDTVAHDFDWTAKPPLPAPLRGVFNEEPRYIDLRWVRREEHLSLRNPHLREALADLAAPIRSRLKDDLFGEDVRQHRRAMWLARGAVATLTSLAVVATVLAILAVQGRNRANAQAALATSRALAAEAASAVGDGRLDVGFLLATQSFESTPSPEARDALAEGLLGAGHLRRVFHEEPVELATISADGRRLAVARRGGELVVRDVATGSTLGSPVPLPGRPEVIALSPHGRMLAVGVARTTSIPVTSGATNNPFRSSWSGTSTTVASSFPRRDGWPPASAPASRTWPSTTKASWRGPAADLASLRLTCGTDASGAAGRWRTFPATS